MTRYIDADVLAHKIHNDMWYTYNDYVRTIGHIDAAPTVDAAPVKHGRWNRIDNDTFHCCECGCTFGLFQGKDHMNYCPGCGAKMDEGKER